MRRSTSIGPQLKRYSWSEMIRYWQTHAAVRASVDPQADPDSLGNVCFTGAPLWLNEYYARGQLFVFNKLLGRVPIADGRLFRALDVGCGSGRWSRMLAARGYSTTGIDLQPSLVEANQRRYPWIQFFCLPIQEFDSKERFDVISSVTVLQHIPHDEQSAAITRMARLLKPGGHIIALENVRDQSPHVFSNRPPAWINKFEDAGLQRVLAYRYDYNPLLRLTSILTRVSPQTRYEADHTNGLEDPELYSARRSLVSVKSRLGVLARLLAIQVDRLVDPVLVRSQLRLPTAHCGFLLTNS
jgi:SAM-dependent methyltransferase